jgi:Mg2+/Co2+ transporter CorB
VNEEAQPPKRNDLGTLTRLAVGMVWVMITLWSGTAMWFYSQGGPWIPFGVLAVVFAVFSRWIPATIAANEAHDDKSPVP